jgi:hypothetical protein
LLSHRNYFFAGFAGIGAGAGAGAGVGAGGGVTAGWAAGVGASAFFSQPTNAMPADNARTTITTKILFTMNHLLPLFRDK